MSFHEEKTNLVGLMSTGLRNLCYTEFLAIYNKRPTKIVHQFQINVLGKSPSRKENFYFSASNAAKFGII